MQVLKAYLSCWEHPGSLFPDFLQPGPTPLLSSFQRCQCGRTGWGLKWATPLQVSQGQTQCCQEHVSNLAVQKKWMWQIWSLGCLTSAASWLKSTNQTARRVVVFGAAIWKRTARTCLLKTGRWIKPPLTCPHLCSSTQNQQNSKRSWLFQTAIFSSDPFEFLLGKVAAHVFLDEPFAIAAEASSWESKVPNPPIHPLSRNKAFLGDYSGIMMFASP